MLLTYYEALLTSTAKSFSFVFWTTTLERPPTYTGSGSILETSFVRCYEMFAHAAN